MSDFHSVAGSNVRWKSDFDKYVLRSNFQRRGWTETSSAEEWNFYWGTVHNVRSVFSPDSGIRLNQHQVINHFPHHLELTRKDWMVKNCKRYTSKCEKEGRPVVDIIPKTYSLPNDLVIFEEEFKRHPHSVWIVKPCGGAQGKNIFLMNKMSQLKRFQDLKASGGAPTTRDLYIISRYVHNPLLIGGKKFDLRIYVLVTSFKPLKAFLFREGFARFCTVKYDFDARTLDNLTMHLTNVSFQKKTDEYNASHGGKWSLRNLRLYLEGTRGVGATTALFEQMQLIIYHSLRSVQEAIVSFPQCFELYGYDILIDDDLNPWLIEVNSSPSLSYTTHADRLMKEALINDTLDIVMVDKDASLGSTAPGTAAAGGGASTLPNPAEGGAGAGSTQAGSGSSTPAAGGGGGAASRSGSTTSTLWNEFNFSSTTRPTPERMGLYDLLYDETRDDGFVGRDKGGKKSRAWR